MPRSERTAHLRHNVGWERKRTLFNGVKYRFVCLTCGVEGEYWYHDVRVVQEQGNAHNDLVVFDALHEQAHGQQ